MGVNPLRTHCITASVPYPVMAGVTWHTNLAKWMAQLSVRGRQRHLGYFDDEEEAAQVYDEAAAAEHTTPVLNFLPDGSLNPHRHLRSHQRRWVKGNVCG
jgi:hypothetical protein